MPVEMVLALNTGGEPTFEGAVPLPLVVVVAAPPVPVVVELPPGACSGEKMPPSA